MPKLKLIKLNKVGKKLKKISKRLAEKSFMFFSGLLFIVLLLGLVIFYHYVFLIKTADEIVKEEELLKLDTETQKRVLEEWQKRNQNFQAADFKEYPNPFYKVD